MKELTATVNALASGHIQFWMTRVGGFSGTACCPSCRAQTAEQYTATATATVEKVSFKSILLYCLRANFYIYL
jgi:hypothetical protein